MRMLIPATIGNGEFLHVDIAAFQQPFREPLFLPADRVRELAARQTVTRDLHPRTAGTEEVGRHVVVGQELLVTEHEAVVWIVERETLGERFDRILQRLLGLTQLPLAPLADG